MTEVTEVVLDRGVTEYNASNGPTFVFDSRWRRTYMVTKVMFGDCDIKSCGKEEADVLVNLSGYLDAIWPTL